MTTKYRIAWRIKKSGTTGHGKRIFTDKQQAQAEADFWNARETFVHHWPEPVDIDEGQEQ